MDFLNQRDPGLSSVPSQGSCQFIGRCEATSTGEGALGGVAGNALAHGAYGCGRGSGDTKTAARERGLQLNPAFWPRV